MGCCISIFFTWRLFWEEVFSSADLLFACLAFYNNFLYVVCFLLFYFRSMVPSSGISLMFSFFTFIVLLSISESDFNCASYDFSSSLLFFIVFSATLLLPIPHTVLWWWPQVGVIGMCSFFSSTYRSLKIASLPPSNAEDVYPLWFYLFSLLIFWLFWQSEREFQNLAAVVLQNSIGQSSVLILSDLSIVFGSNNYFFLPDILSSFDF